MSITQAIEQLENNINRVIRTSNDDNSFEGFPTSDEDNNFEGSPRHITDEIMSSADLPVLAHSAKFAGTVDISDPDKDRLERYNVNHFIADVESRLTSRKIQDEAAKIKEALVFVHPDKGDAHTIIISSMFTDVTTWDQFKQKCRSIWLKQDHKDRFFNLTQLRTIKKEGSDYSYMVKVRDTVDRLVTDIQANAHITKHAGGPRDQLVDLREVITYISYCTIYAIFPDDYKLAFKKITLDPKEDHLALLTRLKDKVTELKVRREDEIAAVTRHMQQMGETSRSSTKVTNKPQNTQKANDYCTNATVGSNRGRYNSFSNHRGSKHYSSQGGRQNMAQYNNQNVGYSTSNYSKNNRGRGNYQHSNPRSRMECKKCGRTNHWTSACRMCDCCNKIGHSANECYYRQRPQNPPPGQGQGPV